jgi:hypothetical protein
VTVLTHATPHARTTTTTVTDARSLPSLRPAPAPVLPTPVLPTPVDRRFEELLASLPLTRSVVVDLPGRRLVVDGAPVDLTRQEFDLVAYLARSAGRVVTRDELFAAAWRSQDLSAATRTIDVHVRRVRAKSGLDGLIATVRGVGYRLNVLDGLRVEG